MIDEPILRVPIESPHFNASGNISEDDAHRSDAAVNEVSHLVGNGD